MKKKNTILKITLKTEVAEYSDISDLGRYSDEPFPNAIFCSGEREGEFVSDAPEDYEWPAGGRQYRFFIPAMTGDETGNPDSPKQDYERAKAFGESWWFNTIQATAQIKLACGLLQKVSSGSILSDSDYDESDIKSVKADQLAELRAALLDVGFNTGEINKAFKTICEIS